MATCKSLACASSLQTLTYLFAGGANRGFLGASYFLHSVLAFLALLPGGLLFLIETVLRNRHLKFITRGGKTDWGVSQSWFLIHQKRIWLANNFGFATTSEVITSTAYSHVRPWWCHKYQYGYKLQDGIPNSVVPKQARSLRNPLQIWTIFFSSNSPWPVCIWAHFSLRNLGCRRPWRSPLSCHRQTASWSQRRTRRRGSSCTSWRASPGFQSLGLWPCRDAEHQRPGRQICQWI